MKEQEFKNITHRRGFITTILGGAAAFGLTSIIAPLPIQGENIVPTTGVSDVEQWLSQIKGKHKMVFDAPKANIASALGWGLGLLDTYKELGVPETEISAVIVLRSVAAVNAINDSLWIKYKLGERAKLKDSKTKQFATKNLFAKCKTEDDDCIEIFQKRGGLICACNHALEGMSEGLAKKHKLKKEDVIKEVKDNLLPGIQLMPSGIWGLNRAQELGCTSCYAG